MTYLLKRVLNRTLYIHYIALAIGPFVGIAYSAIVVLSLVFGGRWLHWSGRHPNHTFEIVFLHAVEHSQFHESCTCHSAIKTGIPKKNQFLDFTYF